MFTKLITAGKRTKALALALAMALLLTAGSITVFATNASLSPSSQTGCVGQKMTYSGDWGSVNPFTVKLTYGDGSYDTYSGYAYGQFFNHNFGSTGHYGQHLSVTDGQGGKAGASSTTTINCQR